MVTRRCLSRRTVLRGMGTAVALPLLDAMIPAMTAEAQTAARGEALRRLGFVYMPMGCDISRWTPENDGPLSELPPILEPIAPVREHVTVISNTELRNAYPGTHATSNAAFLSASVAKRTESTDYHLGITADQLAAQHLGSDTPLPSLELAMDLMSVVGQCDNGYACVYQNCLSWSSPTSPLPAEAHPRMVFEAMFGEGGTTAERRSLLRARASLLDSITGEWASLRRELGASDRNQIDSYLESVRDVEQRIQRAEAVADEHTERDLDRPLGVPASYDEHARLMFDLQVLALQANITRVITFQLARETSNRTYSEIGVPEPHHPLTHHGNDPDKIEKMAKINRFHVSLFAEFLEKLQATPEASGSLLDHVVYLYGSGMGNPNIHNHVNLPILVAGGAAGKMRGGRHLRYDQPTPLANLHLTLLDRVGVPIESFADSNGKIEDLFET